MNCQFDIEKSKNAFGQVRTILEGDCLQRLREFPDNYFHAVVTDPPYGLKFMGKKWDVEVPSTEIWQEVLRVLKPGGHVLSFGGTRTYHHMTMKIELAGFEIRDQIQWIYGSGFPKSHNLANDWMGWGTALKPANEPVVLARKPLEKGLTVAANVLKWGCGAINIDESRIEYRSDTDKASAIPQGKITTKDGKTGVGAAVGGVNNFEINRDEWAAQMKGRWPANVLFDEAAAGMLDEQTKTLHASGNKKKGTAKRETSMFGIGENGFGQSTDYGDSGGASRFFYVAKASKSERNKGLDGAIIWEKESWEKQGLNSLTENILRLAKDTSDDTLKAACKWNTELFGKEDLEISPAGVTFTISTALKLITELKTSNAFQSSSISANIQGVIKAIEANGLSLAESVEYINQLKQNTISEKTELVLGVVLALLQTLFKTKSFAKSGNFHSTVKPIKLMEYLVKLITPSKGIILDPFCGSGSTGVAAIRNGFGFVGIEREKEYCKIAEKRIETA